MENVLGILDAGFGAEMEATFLEDIKKARVIKLEEWRKRGPWQRFKERVFALFEEQY
jgi:phosphatidylserine/phosphatidylglycerophosphate/cardiolipin synthase-like enzyme